MDEPAAPDRTAPPSPRTRVKRVPEVATYDRGAIDAVLDEALVCHLGFVQDGQPFVIPTLHARIDDELYLHGSSASRALKVLADGAPVCVTVTLLDGLVLARSIFEHSVEYRSVVVLGTARLVEDPDEKMRVLKAFSEQLIPGRWAEARTPNDKEMKATWILALPLNEASAKISLGPPEDADSPDGDLPVWAGNLPLRTVVGEPVADPAAKRDLPIPDSILDYIRPGWN
jgi:nitroimidazol reductase NimA-like FMN-containing flavoprotein (pyridoxamine 5'-phosphate oxidase superfamily)